LACTDVTIKAFDRGSLLESGSVATCTFTIKDSYVIMTAVTCNSGY